ncbi:hypothetical protein LCGC14_2160190, partial [marine sediment metagenome]
LALIQNQTQQRQFAERQAEILALRRQEFERPQQFFDQKSGQIITAPRGGGDISAQRIPGRVQAPTLAEVLGTQAGRPTPPGVEGFVPGVTEQQPAARPTVGGNLASLGGRLPPGVQVTVPTREGARVTIGRDRKVPTTLEGLAVQSIQDQVKQQGLGAKETRKLINDTRAAFKTPPTEVAKLRDRLARGEIPFESLSKGQLASLGVSLLNNQQLSASALANMRVAAARIATERVRAADPRGLSLEPAERQKLFEETEKRLMAEFLRPFIEPEAAAPPGAVTPPPAPAPGGAEPAPAPAATLPPANAPPPQQTEELAVAEATQLQAAGHSTESAIEAMRQAGWDVR